MSTGEIWWRCRAKLRAPIDRMMLPSRSRPPSSVDVVGDVPAHLSAGANHLGAHFADADWFPAGEGEAWRSALIAQADRVLEHVVPLFGLGEVSLGNPIVWNYEPEVGRATPLTPAPRIDYRAFDEVGDCKLVWEPNRHQHFVVLARAYRVTRDERYAEELASQFDTWLTQCPYGYGMNWRSPLELGIRLINWVWALAIVNGSQAVTPELFARIVHSVERHLWDITRNYSRFSSANNHVIGEAAGVFIATSFFDQHGEASARRMRAREILELEIIRQSFEDGGTREQAWGYQLFVSEFFLLCALAGKRAGEPFSPRFLTRLQAMLDFVARLNESGGSLPMVGDADDGYVLDLGGRDNYVESMLYVAGVMFDRPDFRAHGLRSREYACWAMGSGMQDDADDPVSSPSAAGKPLKSVAFSQSGYYLLQRGGRDDHGDDRISVLMDCGELGFLSLAAHGHADSLSLVVRVGGHDVLVDPGTYDYFADERWRKYFRSTRAHNTLEIDGLDQSAMLGAFLWGDRAQSRCTEWAPTERGGRVVGEHDGYTRLADPIVHRRTVVLSDDEAFLSVEDEVVAAGAHDVSQHWHFSEHCDIEQNDTGSFRVSVGGRTLVLSLDPQVTATLIRGDESSFFGWVSRKYHKKVPSYAIVGRLRTSGKATLRTQLSLA